MRCPKCSFTSFDHLVTCEKCGRDLTEIVGQLHGTSFKVESPSFLESALKTPAAEEAFVEVSGGTEDVSLGLDQEVDLSPVGETGAAETYTAEKNALDREPDKAKEEPLPGAAVPDAVDLKLQMEGVAEDKGEDIKPAAEKPGPAVEAVEEQTGKTNLNFDGLDLSDLSPADNPDMEGEEAEESPLDLWSLDTSGEDDLADLFDDLLPTGKTQKQAPAADEQAAAEGIDAESATAADDQPEKDDS